MHCQLNKRISFYLARVLNKANWAKTNIIPNFYVARINIHLHPTRASAKLMWDEMMIC
ncbi:hypothetical protein ACVW1A_000345 [Bradyrhizobium sp. LB1.3]